MTLNDDKSVRVETQIQVGDAPAPIAVDITAHLEVQERRRIQFVHATYAGDETRRDVGPGPDDPCQPDPGLGQICPGGHPAAGRPAPDPGSANDFLWDGAD